MIMMYLLNTIAFRLGKETKCVHPMYGTSYVCENKLYQKYINDSAMGKMAMGKDGPFLFNIFINFHVSKMNLRYPEMQKYVKTKLLFQKKIKNELHY